LEENLVDDHREEEHPEKHGESAFEGEAYETTSRMGEAYKTTFKCVKRLKQPEKGVKRMKQL
jgi:hypothetical protein